MTTRDGLIERVEAAATTFERDQATFAKIAGLVVLWYLPWNAAKAALWEVASGDRAFTPEAMLDLIRAALSDPSDQTDADVPTPPQGAWPDDEKIKRALDAWERAGGNFYSAMRAALIAAGPPPSPEPVTEGDERKLILQAAMTANKQFGQWIPERWLDYFVAALAALRLGRV